MGLNLGKLETIDKKDHKSLANRIEEIITGAENSLFPTVSDQMQNYLVTVNNDKNEKLYIISFAQDQQKTKKIFLMFLILNTDNMLEKQK